MSILRVVSYAKVRINYANLFADATKQRYRLLSG